MGTCSGCGSDNREDARFCTRCGLALSRDWLAAGHLAYEQGRYQEALAAYERETSQNVISVEAWRSKAATLLLLERAEEALLAYDHAISLCPNDPELWTARAGVLRELQRPDEEMYCYE